MVTKLILRHWSKIPTIVVVVFNINDEKYFLMTVKGHKVGVGDRIMQGSEDCTV